METSETLGGGPQCLLLSLKHVRSVFGRLRHRGIASGAPTPTVLFFHVLSCPGGEQVVDSSELHARLLGQVVERVGVVSRETAHPQGGRERAGVNG